jgi:phosphohistidine phosphatase
LDLYVLRHGEAGKAGSLSKDYQRPLTEPGRKRIEQVGDTLKEWELDFSKIMTSPLKRAKETAEIVAKILNLETRLEEVNELKPEGNRSELYQKLSKIKEDDSVLIVGHEPYLSALIGDAIASNPQSRISLKKGGLARLVITSFSPTVAGELRWLLTPRQIRKIK